MLQTTHLLPTERLMVVRPRSPRTEAGETSGRVRRGLIAVTGDPGRRPYRTLHLILSKISTFITTFLVDILQRFIRTIRGLLPPLIPDYGYSFIKISTLLQSPSPIPSKYPVCHVKRCTSVEDVTHLCESRSTATASDTRRRDPYRESPEILGRTSFFVLAAGRAPP